MYDAIIVGARCAGSPVARLLAQKGYRVLVVDKSRFPSDIMSTHYIHQPGLASLKRWGLFDRVVATGCPPVRRATLDVGPFALTARMQPIEDIDAAYVPRRTLLDKILVDAAAEAGAEVREGFAVQAILADGDRVTGIRGRGARGPVTEQARIVIGADGLHSIVARRVEAPTYDEVPSLTCGYYSYFSGVAVDSAELYPRDGRFAITFPTNDGLTCVAVQWPGAEFHTFRSDIEGNFYRTLDDCAPGLAERVRAGRREERWVGTADLPNFFRKPYGPGWALVGDAGYHQDPNTGQGITNAFRDADLLAEAIDAGFSGRRPLEDALADYERRRYAAAKPLYDVTMQLASLQPPPEDMQQLFGALRGNQADTDQFFGVMAGTTSPQEFYDPENIGRILAEAESLPQAA